MIIVTLSVAVIVPEASLAVTTIRFSPGDKGTLVAQTSTVQLSSASLIPFQDTDIFAVLVQLPPSVSESTAPPTSVGFVEGVVIFKDTGFVGSV
jgi:hypothetical protein